MVAIAALLWSTGGFLIKLVHWNALAINGARSAFALALLLLYRRRPEFTWSFPQIGGAVSYVAVTATFTAATQLTTAANTIFIQYTAPIYVALLGAYFLNEPVRRRDWLAIASVLGGLFFFFLGDLTFQGMQGIVLAILSSFCLASLIIFLRKQKDQNPVDTILMGNLLAVVFGIPFMFSSTPVLEEWRWLAMLGLFQLGLPFILQTTAIKSLTAVEVISIQVLEPVFNPVWAFLFVAEVPGPWTILGGCIVLAAVTARGILSAREVGR